jgi:outer membrane receptor protein involved in Fe transport
LDTSAQYNIKLFKTNLGLRVDVFNLTNQQTTTTVQQRWNQIDTGSVQTYKYWGMETSHQQERRIRVAVRWTF